MIVKMFKAQRSTNRFRKNQKVWVRHDYGNHMIVWFKWRGRGRYVQGTIDKFTNTSVGPLQELDVADSFARVIHQVPGGE